MQYLLLSAEQAWGGVATFFLLLLCFLVVHIVKFSLFRYGVAAQKPERQEKKTEQPPAKKAEPVFYIVEKKRVRKSPRYTLDEPKRIEFKEEEKV